MPLLPVSTTLLALALLAPSADTAPGDDAATEPSTTAEAAAPEVPPGDVATEESAPPPEAAPDASPPKTIQSANLDAYSAWTIRVAAAIDATNDDPSRGAAELAAALDQAPGYAVELSNDDGARTERNSGLLALARAHLALGDEPSAIATMDEALRSAGSDPLQVERYGPSLTDLYRQRVAALDQAGKGGIRVNCASPCRVYLNEHPAPARSSALWVGPYRVHIESADGSQPAADMVVVVAEAGMEVAINYPSTVEGPATPAGLTNGPGEPGPDAVKKPRRVLPRWLEVTAIIGGAAAVGAGTFFYLANSRCVGDFQTTPTAEMPGTCSDIYRSKVGGLAAIGAGAAFFAGGVITLSIDESRARRQRKTEGPSDRTVMIGYTRRF